MECTILDVIFGTGLFAFYQSEFRVTCPILRTTYGEFSIAALFVAVVVGIRQMK